MPGALLGGGGGGGLGGKEGDVDVYNWSAHPLDYIRIYVLWEYVCKR